MSRAVYQDFVVRARDRFTRPMQNMQRQTTMFSRNAQRSLGRVNNSFDRMRRLARFATGAIATGLVARGIGRLVSAGADLEGVTTQFETLTGSIESARDLVSQMNEFAASTPLQFDTLAQGTQRLMAFGVAQDDVLDTLQMLGDAALGDANKLDSLTRAFGKVQARGKASMEEINMVIDAGVPIMDALNQEFGTTTEELSGMIRNGEVTSQVFQQAFRRMTTEGGQFANGMERQSQTAAGMFSTLKDNVQLTAATLGQALLPTVKDLTTDLIELTGRLRSWIGENEDLIQQKVEDVITGIGNAVRFLGRMWDNGTIPALITAVATFKTLTAAVAAAQAVMVTFKAAQAAAAAAGGVLNAVLLANPIGLIIAGVAALVAGIVLLVKNWDKLKAAMQRFGEWVSNVFAGVLEGINGAIERVANFLGISNSRDADEGRASNAERYGMSSENMGNPRTFPGTVARSTVSENRSTVDINMNGLPSGSTVRQTGSAPGVSLNTGFQGATP